MPDDELTAALEQIGERRFAGFGVEDIGLLDAHPRQFAPLSGKVVVQTRERFLLVEQFLARFEPFRAGGDLRLLHGWFLARQRLW